MIYNGVIESYTYSDAGSLDSQVMSTATAKTWLEVEHSEHDTLIASLIIAAEDYIYTTVGLHSYYMTSTLQLQKFPNREYILFPSRYVEGLNAATYYDENGSQQNLASAVTLTYDTLQDPQYRYLKIWKGPDETWPDVDTTKVFPINISFTTGFDGVDAVPNAIQTAIKLLVADWYENRENPSRGIPTAVDKILSKYRMIRV